MSCQIQYANTNNMPFVAISGKHGSSNNLGNVKHGVGINMRHMNHVQIAEDGKSATIGGGILTKQLIDALWEEGKLASTSSIHQCFIPNTTDIEQ